MIKVIGVQELPVDEVVPYPGNARRGNVAVIMDSVREFGQYRPLVCRARDGKPPMVLAGNHTLMALAGLGQETARCELIECSDDEARRINIADNRTADLATWDDTALAAQLASFGDDFAGTGFTAADASKIMYGAATGADDDAADDGEMWGVIAECDDEQAQAELLARLDGEGFKVRALIR